MLCGFGNTTRKCLNLVRINTLRDRFPARSVRLVASVANLESWRLETFQQQAFDRQLPAILPQTLDNVPPACHKWFESVFPHDSKDFKEVREARLKSSYWQAHSQSVVPLEITSQLSDDPGNSTFETISAPLELLLAYLESGPDQAASTTSIYLAQHDLRDLPKPLQDDLPTPELVIGAGKGDVYSSSLWLGKAPTYTPLHRDPNPNLFMQLAGRKTVRLFRPEVGHAIFELTQRLLKHHPKHPSSIAPAEISPIFRGEEMMQGSERKILHDLVWADVASKQIKETEAILQHGHDAILQPGQALFIPKGWWHSVRGFGRGVIASANWWFR